MAGRRRTHSNVPRPERACVVGVAVRGEAELWSLDYSLDELSDLARAGGARVVRRVTQVLPRPSPSYMGKGRLDDLIDLVADDHIEAVIFDDELTPGQQRTLENLLKVKVIDRTALILDVFARRARTREGKLQIELAQGEYLLPRLAGQWSHLERLGGGIGTRGPGESQIETDRRLIRSRLSRIKKDLDRVRTQRDQQRRNRSRGEVRNVSLVGYTNAGKSALFNRLTAGGAVARDQLFSTLDTTTRRLFLPSGAPATLSDTVGFVHKLPPILIEAFRATLEELHDADILLLVIDASDPYATEQAQVVDDTLIDMGLEAIPRILVLNKLDLLTENPDTEISHPVAPADLGAVRAVSTSAERAWGIEMLRAAIDEELGASTAHIPSSTNVSAPI